MHDKLEELENLVRTLPEEKRDGVAWVLENITTFDRMFYSEEFTVTDKDNIALDAAIRQDYHMLALIL